MKDIQSSTICGFLRLNWYVSRRPADDSHSAHAGGNTHVEIFEDVRNTVSLGQHIATQESVTERTLLLPSLHAQQVAREAVWALSFREPR